MTTIDGGTHTPRTRRKAGPTDGRKTSKNMGRPLGSRDKFPRVAYGTRDAVLRGGVEERSRALETEVGRLQRMVDEFEAEKAAAVWPGDIASMLIAAGRGSYRPTMLQLVAARTVWQQGIEQERAALDGQRQELAQQRQTYSDGSVALDKLIVDFAKFTADREAELSALVEAGDVTPNGAKVIRTWFVEEKPEPLALPPPATSALDGAAETASSTPGGAWSSAVLKPVHAPYDPAVTASSAPAPAAQVPPAIEPTQLSRVLWADRPFRNFQTASGKRFESLSDATVEITAADDDDVKNLLAMGCRERK
jgi:hypothetical protein